MLANQNLALSTLTLQDFLTANERAYTRTDLVQRWSRRQLDTGMSKGTVTRLLTGVYCATVHSQSPAVRGEALNLWQPAGVATGSLALHLYAPQLPKPECADYVVGQGNRLTSPPWARLHQTGPLRSRIHAQGVECAPMPRSLLDAWRYSEPSTRSSLMWEALWAKVCTWRQLKGELDRHGRVAGRQELDRLLGWFEQGATTPLEVRAKHVAFADARFREFEWQVELRLGHRRPMVDMMHRRAGVVVELDGDFYHSTRQARDADRSRQTDLTAAGYTVMRFGWRDIFDRPEWCRERLLATVAGRLTHR